MAANQPCDINQQIILIYTTLCFKASGISCSSFGLKTLTKSNDWAQKKKHCFFKLYDFEETDKTKLFKKLNEWISYIYKTQDKMKR